jgi:hypothetical protein
MKQTTRRALAVAPVLALAVGLTVAARWAGPDDEQGGNICVIGGDIVACVPPTSEPPR